MPKLKELKVSILQSKYTGTEPKWDDFNADKRNGAVLNAFSWYNYHFDYKLAAELVSDYLLQNDRLDEHKVWKKVPLRSVQNGIGWYSRMVLMGYPATEAELAKIDNAIAHAITLIPAKSPVVSNTEDNAKKKANIQEVMRDKANLLGGDLEFLLDQFIDSGAKARHTLSPISAMKIANILPQHVPDLIEHWTTVKAEFTQSYAGVQKDLNEGYNYLNKIQQRNLIKFAELVIADLNSYVTFKKASKAKPKRRIKTPSQQVQKLKYMREFKELNLKSVKSEKIIGAKEMFVYSTRKRKLHHYIADESAGNALMVKNNTIVGFDPTKSSMKTIRTPKKQIGEIMRASRPGTRKLFKGIKTVEARISGRFADDLVILKVF